MREESLGLTEIKKYTCSDGVELESGKRLKPVDIAYEAYGQLNEKKTNAILVCHALSGDAHAAGWHEGDEKPGWWDNMIGPGKPLDTEKYFVICSNVLGGCKGTTGPASVDPDTGEPYGLDFPVVTVKDMVNVQKELIDHLEIDQLLAVVGGSLGGMQALRWTIDYPDSVRFCVPIATTARSSPQQVAFNEVRRRAIMSDPKWNEGDYYGSESPKDGLSLARMIGHITYLSDESMRQKFGRKLQDKENLGFDFNIDFEVESYLHYKGEKFVERFDANSYLYITRAIDYFDLTDGEERSLAEAFEDIESKFLVVAISSDWLYPPYQSKEIVRALKANDIEVSYSEIRSSYGHDAFLVEPGQLGHMITDFLSGISVKDILIESPVLGENTQISKAAEVIVDSEFTHLPVSSEDGTLVGIVTAWDIAKAVAEGVYSMKEVMTKEVVTVSPDESISSVTEKMERYNISALPVIDDDGAILGIVTSDLISQLVGEESSSNYDGQEI